MNTTATILITLAIIAVLVLVHEWGHFITARRIGIPVWEFSIGFGYRLFSIKRNGTEYSIRLIPLGGYVRMAGEEPGDEDNPDGYNHRTPLEKMRVAFAGPFMNIVLAFLIFVYLYSVVGIPSSSNQPVIGKVLAENPAAEAGIKTGDRVLSVNGVHVTTWEKMTQQISSAPKGQAIDITVQRQERNLNFSIYPEFNASTGKAGIGVLGQINYQKIGIVKAIKTGLQQTYDLSVLLLSGLGLLVSGGASIGDLSGPVGITRMVGEVAQLGGFLLLSFSAFLSINLGILNLLPIPALDGSRMVFALVEGIRRKPLEPEKEGLIHWLGFLFLMGLMVVVTFNDIVRLIKG